MNLRLSRQGILRYVKEGLSRKLSGRDSARGRIVVVENPELGFDLGPILARVLRVPYFDSRRDETVGAGRAVVSVAETPSDDAKKIRGEKLINLRGNFGEYLLEGLTKGVDIRIEALKISMQQLRGTK